MNLEIAWMELYNELMQSDWLVFLFILMFSFGTVNWGVWFIRRVRSLFYKPMKGEYNAVTSVVIPVYSEKKDVLEETVDSILANGPDEVILVLDHSETELMDFVQNKYGKKVIAEYIETPGKRPALAKGIKLAKGEIVVLVDSDTHWEGTDFLQKLLVPFRDPKVGGVGSRQRVKDVRTWGQRIIDWNLDLKYTDYVPSDSLSGSVLCLSGRTAAYRRDAILPVLHKLTSEKFLWHLCMGGDDARLTSLVLMQGYKTVFQGNAVANSPFNPLFRVYLKQKVRWSRNSFRTYLKAVFSLWPWRQGRAYYLMAAYHTLVPGLSLFISIGFIAYAVYLEAFSLVLLWLFWAVLSRLIKSSSHLRKRPSDLLLLVVVIIYYYVLSFIKLYALFTMTRESWSGSRTGYRIVNGVRVARGSA